MPGGSVLSRLSDEPSGLAWLVGGLRGILAGLTKSTDHSSKGQSKPTSGRFYKLGGALCGRLFHKSPAVWDMGWRRWRELWLGQAVIPRQIPYTQMFVGSDYEALSSIFFR